MCKHTQYVQRKDVEVLLNQGYDYVSYQDRNIRLIDNTLKRTKSGKQVRTIGLIKNYFRVDNPEVTVKHSSARDNRYKWLKNYNINPTEISIINSFTGEVLPLFIEVPCGYCEECLITKKNKLSTKVKLQGTEYGTPFFITLTVDDSNYSKFDMVKDGKNGLCWNKFCWDTLRQHYKKNRVDEVQRFFKRLRKNLITDGIEDKLTYVIASERGGKTNRVHFHGLIWCNNRSLFDLYDYVITDSQGRKKTITCPKMFEYVRDSWQQGFVTVVEAMDAEGTYALKYTSKSDSWREGILLKSHLGKEAIEKNREWIKNNPDDTEFPILNEYTNTLHTIPIDSWIVNKVYPNVNRSLNHRTRYLMTYCSDIIAKYYDRVNVQYYKKWLDTLTQPLQEYGYFSPLYDKNRVVEVYSCDGKEEDYKYGLLKLNSINTYKKSVDSLRRALKQLEYELSKVDLDFIVSSDIKSKVHKEKLLPLLEKDRIHTVSRFNKRNQLYLENSTDGQ
jgi:hypothetical protein